MQQCSVLTPTLPLHKSPSWSSQEASTTVNILNYSWLIVGLGIHTESERDWEHKKTIIDFFIRVHRHVLRRIKASFTVEVKVGWNETWVLTDGKHSMASLDIL